MVAAPQPHSHPVRRAPLTANPSRFGLSCAIVTPVRPDGTVDLPRLVRHARFVLDGGSDTITLYGTTGEGPNFGMETRDRMLGAILGAGIPADRLYGGVMSSALEDAIRQGRTMLEAGARGLLIAPPFYFKNLGDEGLFAWHARLIEGLGALARGLVVYNLPSVTAVTLSLDLIERFKTAFPGIVVGVKDSSSNWAYTEALLARHGDLAVMVGDERLLPRAVRAGAQGSICGLANLVPGLMRPIVDRGDDSPVIQALVDAIVARPVVPAIKALVAHVHGDPEFGWMLPPLVGLAPDVRDGMIADYEAILARA